jgi:hypothetical protein
VSIDVQAAKRRLMIMGGVNAVAVLAAAVALYGYFVLRIEWGLAAFAVLLGVGVAAQIWFIASLRRTNKGAR